MQAWRTQKNINVIIKNNVSIIGIYWHSKKDVSPIKGNLVEILYNFDDSITHLM